MILWRWPTICEGGLQFVKVAYNLWRYLWFCEGGLQFVKASTILWRWYTNCKGIFNFVKRCWMNREGQLREGMLNVLWGWPTICEGIFDFVKKYREGQPCEGMLNESWRYLQFCECNFEHCHGVLRELCVYSTVSQPKVYIQQSNMSSVGKDGVAWRYNWLSWLSWLGFDSLNARTNFLGSKKRLISFTGSSW